MATKIERMADQYGDSFAGASIYIEEHFKAGALAMAAEFPRWLDEYIELVRTDEPENVEAYMQFAEEVKNLFRSFVEEMQREEAHEKD